jgi:hypothetical protein
MFTKSKFQVIFSLLVVLFITNAAAGKQSGDKVWREVDDSKFKDRPVNQFVSTDSYKTFRLNKDTLKEILTSAPQEYNTVGQTSDIILTLPMPDGSFEKFAIKESPIMEEGLAAKFPEIKTYLGQGIDNPTATTRFDFMPSGFHAMILSDQGTIYINPYSAKDTDNYISFNKANLGKNPNPFFCEVGAKEVPLDLKLEEYKIYNNTPNVVTNGTTLRQYRLALAATGEYTAAVGGGTVAGALAAQVVVMNRVNGVYERELSVRMNIIANNNLIIYTNAATDPYTNSDGFILLGENQANVDNVIGSGNYDIGHVFSTGGGGVAQLRSPCNATRKAQGVTGLPNPVGDPFAIDFVAHEIGHQFGGNHSFNGSSGNCPARNMSTAFEPSSGSTIQAYAGICAPQNLQRNSNDYFHVVSLEEMVAFITNAGTGGSCSANTATGNTVPTVSVVGGTTFNIPQNTPFALTASGNDGNGDALTYNWEEYDLGNADALDQPPNPAVAAPIFRSYLGTTSPSRTFPSLQYILNNNNLPPTTYNCGGPTCLTGEVLPTITRTMTFQVTARDNRAGGGGVNSTTATVNVNAGSGPFKVTAQDTFAPNWQAGTMETVTWNVANTTAAPVSAANVMILLSTDGGQTFPTTLAANAPNNGTAQITVPSLPTTMARIKVQPVNNIFFDISNVNFTITAPTAASATVSGKVVNSDGRAIRRAVVTILDTATSDRRTVTTNSFGYFVIADLPVGNFYILSVEGKGYEFPNNQQTFTLNENLTNVIFVGNSQ